jgi:DNA-binding NarL/FixJ family response regulator
MPQPPSERPIRVLVVDDHIFTRMGVAAALNCEEDIGVVAEADCGATALELFSRHRPDVAVVDLNLPDMHGFDVTREMVRRCGTARVLVFSAEENEEQIHRAVSAGVRGYVPKSAQRPELISAVRRIASGASYFTGPVMEKLRHRRSHITLSTREIEVLQGMARGQANKAIAAEMGVSAETVKTFVTRILEKLGVQDRTRAVIEALDRGLLSRQR